MHDSEATTSGTMKLASGHGHDLGLFESRAHALLEVGRWSGEGSRQARGSVIQSLVDKVVGVGARGSGRLLHAAAAVVRLPQRVDAVVHELLRVVL